MQKDCCRKKGRYFLAMLTVLCTVALGSGDIYAADTKDEATAKTADTKEKVWISGETVGVYLQTKGVLVADIGTVMPEKTVCLQSISQEPAIIYEG